MGACLRRLLHLCCPVSNSPCCRVFACSVIRLAVYCHFKLSAAHRALERRRKRICFFLFLRFFRLIFQAVHIRVDGCTFVNGFLCVLLHLRAVESCYTENIGADILRFCSKLIGRQTVKLFICRFRFGLVKPKPFYCLDIPCIFPLCRVSGVYCETCGIRPAYKIVIEARRTAF